MSTFTAAVLLIAITAVWGWTFAVVQRAIEQFGVLPFLTLRFLLATLLMLPLAVVRRRRGTWRVGMLIGLVLAAAYVLQTYGLRHTSATHCGLITGLFVIFAPLLNRTLFGVPTRPLLWVAAALSVVGLALLTGAYQQSYRVGDLLTLGAAACIGLHIAVLDRVARHHDAAALAGTQFLSATACFALLSPVADRWTWPSFEVGAAIVLTGLVATALGFYVQTLVQQRLAAVQVALILTLEPVFAALFGVWLGGDRLTGWQWSGGAIVLVAMLIAEMRRPPFPRNPG